MRHEIILAPEAVEGLRALTADERSRVKDAMERHLRHQPTAVSRSRIKRLRGETRPQYRLRVDEIRVFYDVADATVEVLAIIDKTQAEEWLQERGKQHEESGAGEGKR